MGDVNWLKNNFGFGETCDYIDELMVINVTPHATTKDFDMYFSDVDVLKKKYLCQLHLVEA